MTIYNRLLVLLLAVTAFAPLGFTSGSAFAQQPSYSSAAPRIDGFDVEPAPRAAAGNELFFTLYGSPGGTASVRISGATSNLLLDEVEPGVYEGTYTIKSRDQITATSSATANLRVGNRVATGLLDESLIAGAAARPAPQAAAALMPRITNFAVDPPNRLVAGGEMFFSVSGDPGGIASARIPGVQGKLVLEEVRSGIYEGLYTIKNRDRIANDAAITANLRIGDQETTVALGYPLMSRVGQPGYRSTGAIGQGIQMCANCGVVEAVNVVEVKGAGNYIGPILGGIAGAVLGSQVGSGRGTTAAQVVGAVGGAVVGREIQKRTTTADKHYEVVVRLENGGSQTVSYPNEPGLSVGTRVRVENGTLIRS